MESNMKKSLSLILSDAELKRICFFIDDFGELSIAIDVHKLSTREASRFLNNVINIVRTDCRVTVIHGYTHGTSIRDMLENQFDNRHVRDRQLDPFNPGRTILSIA